MVAGKVVANSTVDAWAAATAKSLTMMRLFDIGRWACCLKVPCVLRRLVVILSESESKLKI